MVRTEENTGLEADNGPAIFGKTDQSIVDIDSEHESSFPQP